MTSPAPEPVAVGPTWRRDDTGGWLLPERTLGWQILGWTAEYLRQPDGPTAGAPWRYTSEQARFMLWWYALDKRGRFVYRSGMLRRVKGWGKDPIGATICAVEFVGPCRFDGWDAQGEPVGVQHPASWVLTAAVSRDQTRNTMTLFPSLLGDELCAAENIDLGKEIIYANRGRQRIEAVTSSPRALEGARSSFTLKNETQHWLSNNEGLAMAEVINRNATKSRDGASRPLSISNAHHPGEDSDAERDWESYQQIAQGRARDAGFLYDSLEAPPGLDLADEQQLRAGLRAARGDSVWLDEDRHVSEIYDTRNDISLSRRFYLNQIVAAEDAWIDPQEFDVLVDPQEVEAGEPITLGFDGSKSDDHCALIGCRVSDGYTFTLGVWDPADHGGEAPRDAIDQMVDSALEKFRVLAFFSDLHPWESYVDSWAERMNPKPVVKATARHAVAWDMRSRLKEFTIECERLHDEIVERAFTHDGDPRVRQHFHNARRRPNAWGVGISKEHRESARKVDAVPAAILARAARRLVIASGKVPRKRSGRVVGA